MTFEEAIRKAIKAYREGKDPEELMKVKGGESKFTRDYFNDLEEEIVGKDSKKSKKKKKSDEELEA
jgi:hypothetical protein